MKECKMRFYVFFFFIFCLLMPLVVFAQEGHDDADSNITIFSSGGKPIDNQFQIAAELINLCEPCAADAECGSGNCASFEDGSNRCIPTNETKWECTIDKLTGDVVDDGGSGGGCFIRVIMP